MHVTYNGKPYRVPMSYINNEHPGGPDEILPYAGGLDITDAFADAGHSADAEAMLAMYLAGTAPEAQSAMRAEQASRHGGGGEGKRRIDDANRWTSRQTVVAVGTAVLTAGVAALFMWRKA